MNHSSPRAKCDVLIPLICIAIVIAAALRVAQTNARETQAVNREVGLQIFNSPIRTPYLIDVVTDPELASALGQRRYHQRIMESTPVVPKTPSKTPVFSVTTAAFRATPSALLHGNTQSTPSPRIYVPFLQVMYWKGVGNAIDRRYSWPNTNHLSYFHLGWWYDWGFDNTYGEYENEGFIPMVWCRLNSGDLQNLHILASDPDNKGRAWLVFNEPDHPRVKVTATPEDSPTPGPPPTPYYGFLQCAETICPEAVTGWMTPPPSGTPLCRWPAPANSATPTPTPDANLDWAMGRQAADDYATIYAIIKGADSSAKVLCCGQFFTRDTQTKWWEGFLEGIAVFGVQLDGVHIHVYPYTGSTTCVDEPISEVFNCIRSDLTDYWQNVHQNYPETMDKPLWITEYGYLYGQGNAVPAITSTPSIYDVRDGLMKPIVGFLASEHNHGYFRVAWFSVALGDTRTRLMKGTPPPPSELTILGTLWADYDPVHPPTSTVTPTPVP